MKRNTSIVVAASVSVLALAANAKALQLVDFKPLPISPVLPEFGLSATNFFASTGAVSANSASPLAPTVPGGLLISTPYLVPGAINGKVFDVNGSTDFYDTTLVLNATVMANALSYSVPGFGTTIVQPVSNGTFTIYASASPALSGVVLLSGTFSTGGIVGAAGATAASFLANASVNYTGGAIYVEALAELGTTALGAGDLSLSLNDLSTPLTLNGANGAQQLAPFNANATGLFSNPVVPEPISATWASAGGLLLLGRRRRA